MAPAGHAVPCHQLQLGGERGAHLRYAGGNAVWAGHTGESAAIAVSLTAAAPGASDAAGIAAHGKVGVVVCAQFLHLKRVAKIETPHCWHAHSESFAGIV